jgi:tetratricopeptide (TPR) repeat protein
MEQYPQAVAQYDLWIPIHRADIKLPNAYNGRCWARAMLGQDLKQALDDCDRAVRAFPKAASFLDSRGLVRLRMGDYKKSAIDYGAAIQLQPKSAWSLYGRGLDEQHLGDSAASQSDIAAAKAIAPNIVERAAKFGIGTQN